VLEVGCGSGGISHYFATHPQLQCEVEAVDTVDNRQITDGYSFTLVKSTRLPFPDSSFDVVLTNHVIEHVGPIDEQRMHLRELRRVLRPSGTGYIAVPNRWQLVEPHYKLAFLSWLPHGLRTPYLCLSGRGALYGCEPLQMRQLERLMSDADLHFENLSVSAIRVTLEPEGVSKFGAMASLLPDSALCWLRPIIPTLIYRFQPTAKPASPAADHHGQ
jgi:SAM-dependent methyltransferase